MYTRSSVIVSHHHSNHYCHLYYLSRTSKKESECQLYETSFESQFSRSLGNQRCSFLLSVIPEPAASTSGGSLLEMQDLRLHSVLLTWDLHFNNVSRCSVCTIQFEKHQKIPSMKGRVNSLAYYLPPSTPSAV